jgi:hypothetical protein
MLKYFKQPDLDVIYANTHTDITQKWKDVDKMNDCILLQATNMWQEYKAKVNLYRTNRKLLKLYQTLRRIFGEKLTRMDVNNDNNMDSFAEELNNAVQLERNLIKNTKQLRTELLDGINVAIGCICCVVVAVLYIYAKWRGSSA